MKETILSDFDYNTNRTFIWCPDCEKGKTKHLKVYTAFCQSCKKEIEVYAEIGNFKKGNSQEPQKECKKCEWNETGWCLTCALHYDVLFKKKEE